MFRRQRDTQAMEPLPVQDRVISEYQTNAQHRFKTSLIKEAIEVLEQPFSGKKINRNLQKNWVCCNAVCIFYPRKLDLRFQIHII